MHSEKTTQLLLPVKLNGAVVDSTLFDSESSLSMVSASTLAALPVPTLVEPFTSGTPNIVDIEGSPLHVLGYVVAAVAVSDVEVTHRLVVISELAFPLLISIDILRAHRACFGVGSPDFVRLKVDLCYECVAKYGSLASHRHVTVSIAPVVSDTTLPKHAASRMLVQVPPKVHDNSTFLFKPLPRNLAFTASAVFSEVCETTGATCVLSKAGASTRPISFCAGCQIAAVSSETPLQPSPPAFRKQACGPRRDARRLRRPRGRHRATLRRVTPKSSAVRRRCSPSSSGSYYRVWTPSTAAVTPFSSCVT